MKKRPLGPQSSAARFAKLDGRTKLSKLAKTIRAELTEHVGGKPSVTQQLMIEQIVQTKLHLALLDQRAADGHLFSEHDNQHYLAWSNGLSRLLCKLGLKAVAKPTLTLSDHLAQRSGGAV